MLHDLVLAADRVHGRAGGDGVVRADEVAEGSARVLTGKDGDGVHTERGGGVNVHLGEHDVRAEAGAGDERAARADEHGCRRVEASDHRRDIGGEEVHHAGRGGLHDVGDDEKAAHRDEHGENIADGPGADRAVLLHAHTERCRAEHTAHEDDDVHPEDVAERTHDGEAVGHDRREAIAHEREQHEHIDVRRHGAERAVFALLRGGVVAEFLRRPDADELDVGEREKHGDEARAHRGDLRADEVGEEEHHRAGGDAGEAEIGDRALEALFAEDHADHDERNDEHAEHMEAADHRRVERNGGESRVHERRAAVDGRQTRAAPGGGRRVAEQGDGDGGDGIKAEGYEEGRRDGGGSARAGRALEEDGEHHADDDELHAAVIADAGNGGLDVVNGAGLAQQVQNGERAEDHEHDLETLFDALPDQGIEGLDVVGKAGAGDVEVGEGQDQRPDKGDGGDPFGGLLEA